MEEGDQERGGCGIKRKGENGSGLRRRRFRYQFCVIELLITYLKFVLAAFWAEGVGAADEEHLLGRQMRHDSNVILALVLKKRVEGSVRFFFIEAPRSARTKTEMVRWAVGRARPGANLN